MKNHKKPIVIKVVADLLDPEDGEAGIIEEYSGKVLQRFTTLRAAITTLRDNRSHYEAAAMAAVGAPKYVG